MTFATASWLNYWLQDLGFGFDLPPAFVAGLGLVITYGFIVLPSGAIVSYLDRKLSADFQARVGPNRAGPAGIFQPVADLLKLLQKKTVRAWTWPEAFWLAVNTMALYSTVAVLPLGSMVLLIDTDMSVFMPFWATLVLAFGTMLLGLSQGTVPGWFGGIRVGSQALAGAFPALVTLLCAGVRAGGFRWSALTETQGASPFRWTAFSDPFQFVAFVVFLISGLVLLGIPPMDSGVTASDIHGGVSSNLSGRRLILYRMGRFYGFFLWSLIAVVVFLGSWSLPSNLSDLLKESERLRLLQVLELLWLLSKTFILMLVVIWIARVNPRARVDQITDFSWKVLSPFSLMALIGVGLLSVWRALS